MINQKGLINIGSICWGNSLLQTILSSRVINKFFTESETLTSNGKNYLSFINDYFDDEQVNIKSHIKFIRSIIVNNSTFKFGRQQDPIEFLDLFIDKTSPIFENLFKTIYTSTIICTECKNSIGTNEDISYHTLIPNSEIDIHKYLMKHYTTINYKCKHCKINTKCLMSHYLKKTSQMLVIILNQYTVKKIYNYKTTLTFPITKNKQISYNLIGKIKHCGNMQSGHYSAECLRHDKYYIFDDTNYKQLTKFSESDQNDYILFYEVSQS